MADNQTPPFAPPAAFLRVQPDSNVASTGFGDRLVRLFDLRTYRESGLTDPARIAMRRGAMMLGVVLVFDLFMWTLLFDTIFQKGAAEELVQWTLLAMAIAVLFSTATVTFEANLFTADLSRWREPRVFGGIVGRLVLIFGSAFLTAEPLHILLFDGPVLRRAQQEQAIEMAVSMVKQQVDDDADAVALATGKAKTGFEPQITAINDRIGELRQSIGEIDEDIGVQSRRSASAGSRATSQRQNAERYARSAREATDPAVRADYVQRESTARQKATAAAAEKSTADDALAGLRERRRPLQAELDRLGGAPAEPAAGAPVGQGTDAAPQSALGEVLERQRLALEEKATNTQKVMSLKQHFIAQISNGVPDEPIRVEDPLLAEPLTFQLRRPDFWERLRLLDDLMAGARPRWPLGELTDAETVMLRDDMKMSRLAPAETDTERLAKWNAENDELQRDARNYTAKWWLILLIGLAVPVLAFLYKLLLPDDLKNYYTVAWQAALGNPEARINDRTPPPFAPARPLYLPLPPARTAPTFVRDGADRPEPARTSWGSDARGGAGDLPPDAGAAGASEPAADLHEARDAGDGELDADTVVDSGPSTHRSDDLGPPDVASREATGATGSEPASPAEAGAERPVDEAVSDAPASIPFMVTRQMRADLRARGFTDAQIDAMTPQEAWAHLHPPAARAEESARTAAEESAGAHLDPPAPAEDAAWWDEPPPDEPRRGGL